MKKIGPQISEQAIEFYKKVFKSTNAGAEFFLAAMPGAYQGTLIRELKGVFTAGQLKMFIDVMNGTWIMGGMAGQHLPGNVADSFELYPGMYEEKWEIDAAATLKAIDGLTTFPKIVLEVWVVAFWLEAGDLEKYVSTLAK